MTDVGVIAFGSKYDPPYTVYDWEQEGDVLPRKRREMSDGFLRRVVERHEALRSEGCPPTKALAEQEQVSKGAVKHWLRVARQRGLT